VGTGPGEIHPAPTGGNLDVVRNQANYRLTAADRIGEGSLKQKFRQNVAAIELLRTIEDERRPATDAEKAVLVKYIGWGGMPQVFAEPDEAPDWKSEQARMNELLTDDEYRSARASTLNAHYTSPTVIQAMYVALERLGFAHGRVLEPACGLGHFLGFMPQAMHDRSILTGVELDRLTARLAKTVYPDADIRAQGFENAVLPTNSFDVAISNIPFGDYQPFDPKFNVHKYRIHDYFFVAALERVRPGGLLLFITSRGTMDKRADAVRAQLAAKADLVAAIRLPNTAFKRNAHTEVTSDIIILRKRSPGESAAGPAWLNSERPSDGAEYSLNEYFQKNPNMMLGRMQFGRGQYGREDAELVSDGRELGTALAEVVAALPVGIYRTPVANTSADAKQTLPVTAGVKPNAYTVTDSGVVARREGEGLTLLRDLPEQTARRIRGMVRLRGLARECLRSQVEGHSEDAVVHARSSLNQHYDIFVQQFGAISQSANVRAFAGDPDLPLLLSLENYDDDTDVATKTAIFRERTIQAPTPVKAVASASEALVVSLNEKGRVDLGHMTQLLGKQAESFLPELQGAIFLNPTTKTWEAEDEYLSGNVRAKLHAAEQAAKKDSRFQANADALRAVQPTELTATEIDARLGSVWIPPEDVEVFVRELLHLSKNDPSAASVSHAHQIGQWSVRVGYYEKSNVANSTEWGTNRASAVELIEDALNLRTPTVYDLDEKKNPVVSAAATEAAREKQQKIKDRFAEWIWEDDERRERLVRKYNVEFNSTRLRVFNGSHLTLPGASPAITLRPHQKAAVWRILQSPNTLLAHVVGAGKTYTMVAAAMELKRLGLARKPLFVVPNHMLGQFSSELLMLYPGANILVAGKTDFESTRRRQLMSRIATSNWDAVIVTHSGFERLPMSLRAQQDFIKEQMLELELGIREQKSGSDSRIVKDLERAKKRLEAKLKTLTAEHRKDDTITFEELGVDRLFVDEAHAYKNLFYVTKMSRVAGLPQAASERAFDMFLKVQHVQRLNRGAGVVFATGTPVTNTMAELYTLQRFLQMDDLRRQRLQHFDSWAATFGETVSAMELAPDGAGYRINTRFARFVNVPELMQQFRQMADIQTAGMLKLPVPALYEGKAQVVRAPATPELKAVVAALAKRAERLKTHHVDPWEDNMLKITGEGRKAALDLRLVRPRAADHPDSKVNLAHREILGIWQETRNQRLTQMVFCDLSTPKVEGRGFSAYQDLKAKLVSGGVPSNEIAFIQDHETDAAKASLFRDVRAGKVRILFGSTQKMGAGTNAQTLLVALHHLDAPWRPADIEQREGRILRQGNTNGVVKIFRYVTEGSFDAYMWQTLETKAKFIAQIMTGESTARKIEDLDTPALTYAEVKAIASGNPLVIEKAKVDAEVMRLSRLRAQHSEEQFRTRQRVRFIEDEIPRVERQIAGLRADLAVRQDTRGDAFKITLNGSVITERPKAGEALIHLVDRHLRAPHPVILGDLAGFKVEFRSTLPDTLTLHGAMSYPAKVSISPIGIIMSLEHAAHSVEDRLVARQSDLEQYRKNHDELQSHVGKPFEHEDRYRELQGRQAELVTALDITKSQASSALSSEVVEVEAEANKQTIAPTVRLAV
jgi:N12 class adenine-specific DNA methylase/adenine-specific DNA methylase